MVDTTVTTDAVFDLESQGVYGPYWSNTQKAIIVYVDGFNDLSFARTTNGGSSWSSTRIEGGSVKAYSAFFDKENSGNSGTKVHITCLDSQKDECRYVDVDVSNGDVGTVRTVASGLTITSTASQSRAEITQTQSSNIVIAYSTQTEIGCIKSSDFFATSGTTISDVFESATEEDHVIMFPANISDENDCAAIFWDRSANIISLKMYDDSADSWTETQISSSMTDSSVSKNMDGAVRHSDNHILFAAHSNDDSSTDDLRTWDLTVDSITSPTVTAKTNIFTDQIESAQVGMIINQQNDDVYVSYLKGGTWTDSTDIVFHKSDDGMATWGSEQAYSEATADDNRVIHGGRTITEYGGRIQWTWFNDDLTDIFVNLVNDIEIESTIVGTNMQLNIGDSWKSVDAIKINIGDTWKVVAAVKQNIGDSWKTVF